MIRRNKRWKEQRLPMTLGIVLCFPAVAADVPPVRIFGHVGYEYRFDQFDAGDDRMEHSEFLRLNGASYVWQPWFAQVNAGAKLKLSNSTQDTRDRSGTLVTGDARLHLFPVSRFPFEAYYEKRQDSVDDGLFDTETDFDRYGFVQRYTTVSGTAIRARYEHSERNFDQTELNRAETDVNDIAQFSVSKNFDLHSLKFDSSYDRHEDQGTRDATARWLSVLRHHYRPASTFSLNGQISFRETEFDQTRTDHALNRFEWSEYAFWRPKTSKPLLFTGAVRFVDSTTEIGDQDLDQSILSGTVGARYQFTPRWQLQADVSATETDNENGTRTTGLQRALVRYTSTVINLGKADFDWFGSMEAGNERIDDESGDVQYAEMRLGHEISRAFLASKGTPVRLRFHQEASALQDTDERATQILDHDINVSWGRTSNTASTFLGITLSDSRTFGGGGRRGEEAREFQFVNFQLSRNQQLNRDASLNGHVTVQAARQMGILDDEDSEFEPSASVDLSYRHQRVFGVPRLRFRSTLRLFSDSYLPLLDEPDETDDQEGQIWENRLEYTIGRLDLLLLTRMAEIRERKRDLVFFQLRRNFDAFY